MFIQDLKNDFYNMLMGKRILVIVNYDLDAICASKILQSLLKYDHIQYTVVPIMGRSGLQRAFLENHEEVKYVVLINCGACIDIVEDLQPKDDVIFFVCDSHRPLDICNVYSDNQIRILGEINQDENIPAFESLFKDTDDEDDEQDSNDESGGQHSGDEDITTNNRVARLENQILKRREQKTWEDNRNKLLFEYTQYSYYGKSSSILIFELAWKLTKDSMDLLWWAIVGLTEQFVLGKIESATYVLECQQIQSHVSRLTNKTNDRSIQAAVKIAFENDLHLALYRHWSVHDSLKNSIYPACKLKLWTLRGEKKLHELLVEIGLPLAQAKQTFKSMDLELRKEFHQMIEKYSSKYNMADIMFGSFTLQYGYRNKYSASDYVYSMVATLESVKIDRTPEQCFWEALDSLSRQHKILLDMGIDRAKDFLNAIFKQVQPSLEMHQVHSAGPFLYFILNEENSYFSCPYGLIMLAKFILRGQVAVSRNRRVSELPLVASCPIDIERGLCLMIGIAPVCEDSPKNFFGKAFEQAAIKSSAIISPDLFESSIIQIRMADITKFIDGLTVLLS